MPATLSGYILGLLAQRLRAAASSASVPRLHTPRQLLFLIRPITSSADYTFAQLD
ncbi:MAG: hypothetical protein QMB55_03990 [Propionivibrio sp.]